MGVNIRQRGSLYDCDFSRGPSCYCWVKSVDRFPPPWTAEDNSACFIVRDRSGQAHGCIPYVRRTTAEGSGGARAWCDKAIWLAQEAETFFTKIDSVPITFNVLAATAARPRALSELNP